MIQPCRPSSSDLYKLFTSEAAMYAVPRRFLPKLILSAAIAVLLSGFFQSASAQGKFLGVASCSSSNCHGGVAPRKGTNVLQNEYSTWFKYEAHSQAYSTLLKPESKTIAKLLGIGAPEQAEECLKCHATYAPGGRRGPKFRVSDGVGCESCHGAAEKWIQPHTSRESKHATNVQLGLIDLVSLNERAKICLDCHFGDDNQVVDHRLIGAGHPRLTFELDTYSVLQPNHWELDQDYVERKSAYSAARAWMVAQVRRSSDIAEMISSKKRSTVGAMPELTLFYCYSCHHSLTEDQWKTRSYGGKPGELRLNVSSLLIVREALRVLDGGLAGEVEQKINALTNGVAQGTGAEVAASVKTLLDGRVQQAASGVSGGNAPALLKQIVKFSATTPFLQFEVAEQAAMGMSALTAAIDPSGKQYKSRIDAIYNALKNEEAFQPEAFTKASQAFLSTL